MTITADLAAAMPQDLINSKPVIAALKEFFGSSQLSQFMDQINALAEITHKRRLSALGPGGLSRETGRLRGPRHPDLALRPDLPGRDAGRPEHRPHLLPQLFRPGQRVRLHRDALPQGRERPDRRLRQGPPPRQRATTRSATSSRRTRWPRPSRSSRTRRPASCPSVEPYCFYLTAWEEEKYNIAQANAVVDERGRFQDDLVSARERGNFKNIPREQIHYIDVSPKQLVSLSAALIPFLEHDDANRALMGSNMQRQAVPLIRPEAPLIGTGIEGLVAEGSGDVVVCRRSGVVEFVDAERIIVRVDEKEAGRSWDVGTDLYTLVKFLRTNQNTSTNHRPIVRKGDKVRPRPGPGRQLLHGRRRAGPRPQRPLRLHALAGLQLRGRHHRQREAHQGGHLHLAPHRRGDDRGPRHQARPRGDHPRHPQRPREPAPQPRRERHRPHRRPRQVGRHPGRQGRPEGGDPAVARGEAPQGDLRREGARRQGRLPLLLARRRGDHHRRPHLLPPRHREGAAGQGHREGRDRDPQAQPRRRDRHHGEREVGEGPGPAQGLGRREDPEARRRRPWRRGPS